MLLRKTRVEVSKISERLDQRPDKILSFIKMLANKIYLAMLLSHALVTNG